MPVSKTLWVATWHPFPGFHVELLRGTLCWSFPHCSQGTSMELISRQHCLPLIWINVTYYKVSGSATSPSFSQVCKQQWLYGYISFFGWVFLHFTRMWLLAANSKAHWLSFLFVCNKGAIFTSVLLTLLSPNGLLPQADNRHMDTDSRSLSMKLQLFP